jgi:CheY-like chemotaxis protein
MNMSDLAKLIDSVAHLLGVLVWPGLLGFIALRLGPHLAPSFEGLIASLGEMSVKGPGIDVTIKTKVAANLAAARVARTDANTTPEAQIDQAREAAEAVADLTPTTFRIAQRARILWVDDQPDNNIFERQAFEELGMSFVLSSSTDDAFDKITTQHFDVIISDMSRPPDHRAGYTLLDKLRRTGDNTPYIIYTGSRSPEQQAEAKQHRATGSTNQSTELLEMIIQALRQSSYRSRQR